MARLYANEDFAFPVIQELRRLGHDVQTAEEAGQAGRAVPDEAVLEHAIRAGRAVITLNRRHFVRLHAEKPDHNGVIVCSFDASFESLARRIHTEIAEAGSLEGVLVRVNRPG